MFAPKRREAAELRLAGRFYFYQWLAGILIAVAAFLLLSAAAQAQTSDAEGAEPASEENTTEETASPDEAVSSGGEAETSGSTSEVTPSFEVDVSSDDIGAEDTGDVMTDVSTPSSPSVEAAADAEVAPADLGVEKSRVLPNSPWYGFKRFGRSFRETLTFNPVKKTELRLKHASQELVDAEAVVAEAEDASDLEAASEAMERYGRQVEKIQADAVKIFEKKQAGEDVQPVLKEVLDTQLKHQKVFERFEKHVLLKLPEEVQGNILSRIAEVKERAAAAAGGTMVSIEDDPEALKQVMDDVLAGQRGSAFKDIHNLEVLRRLEDHVPEEAREAIRQAEGNALKRFAAKFQELPPEIRDGKFEQYVQSVSGDETRQLEIFDEIKSRDDVPEEVKAQMELAKDIAAKRFQERLEKLETDVDDPELREQLRSQALARFQGGEADIGKLRALEDIRQRADFHDPAVAAEIEKQRTAQIEKFTASFPDAAGDAAHFQELSRQMAENPDPATFRLIEELEAKVKADPAKRAFIEQMDREVKSKFLERAESDGDKFFAQISSSNPEDIAVFQRLQKDFGENPEDFFARGAAGEASVDVPGDQAFPRPSRPFIVPPGAQKFFDQAIEKQSERITSHIERIQDPALFEQFRVKLEGADPTLRAELERRQKDFGRVFAEKERFTEQFGPTPEERAARWQIDQGEADFRSDFEARYNDSQSFEERQALDQERVDGRKALDARNQDLQKQLFENRKERSGQTCDAECQARQEGRFRENGARERDGNNLANPERPLPQEQFRGGRPEGLENRPTFDTPPDQSEGAPSPAPFAPGEFQGGNVFAPEGNEFRGRESFGGLPQEPREPSPNGGSPGSPQGPGPRESFGQPSGPVAPAAGSPGSPPQSGGPGPAGPGPQGPGGGSPNGPGGGPGGPR